MSHKALNSTFVCTDCIRFKSQVVELGRHLWRSLVQPPCSSRATYSQLLSTMARRLLIIPRMVIPQAPWATFVVHPHSEKAFPDVQMKSFRCAELRQSYSQRGQATQTKHSYMGCLNIHLPEHLPLNHCPADTLLEVEELGKERPG